MTRFIAILSLCCSGCAQRAATSGNTREDAVHFSSGNIALAGTLVIPAGSGRHPAVVLFHGSGPQRRDLFMARWFALQGVAALAYDKRGVGESGGNFRTVPFMDLADNGLSALRYLKSRAEIDPQHIGVWGLSQGGGLGPLAASRSPDIAFVIAVSGPGVSPGEQMLFYYAKELEARGVPEHDIREATALRRDVWTYLSSGQGYEKTRGEMRRAQAKNWYDAGPPDSWSARPARQTVSRQAASRSDDHALPPLLRFSRPPPSDIVSEATRRSVGSRGRGGQLSHSRQQQRFPSRLRGYPQELSCFGRSSTP